MAVAGPHWHCRWGELDLVLERHQQQLVVEVKGCRTGHRDRHGLDAFHSAKGTVGVRALQSIDIAVRHAESFAAMQDAIA